MKKASFYIGTSGWSYKHWKDIYYPADVKPAGYLEYYSRQFNIAEINTSFYHLPQKQTVLNWMEAVPKGFRFCPKMSRYLTHMKKLHDPEAPLEKFFAVFEAARKMLGPVLIQLPPSLKFNPAVAVPFFELLKKEYKRYDFVLEVRHNSWMETESLGLLKRHNIGFVISQSENKFPYAEHVTAKNIYVRFHGPAALYASSYSDEMLKDYAAKFKKWIEQGHIIWAFFNNDIYGHAFRDAERLKQLML
jgi:uncharacterized protein YecE (DUF72 family)